MWLYLKVVAGRSRPEAESLRGAVSDDDPRLGQLGGAQARVVVLASEVAEGALVADQVGRQEARGQPVLQADRLLAVALLTNLKCTSRLASWVLVSPSVSFRQFTINVAVPSAL